MTKAGSVAVSLSRNHCLATAWWLSHRYIPFALERSRQTGCEFDAFHFQTAVRLAGDFTRFAMRRLKGADQERDAARTFTRADAAWLAAMILSGHDEEFPDPVAWIGDFPNNGQLAAMPLQVARIFLFGLGACETMRRCHDRAYARKVGPKPMSLTLADVAKKHVGNPANGGDERYERRLRQRAREDEIAAQIAEKWDEGIRALAARSER